ALRTVSPPKPESKTPILKALFIYTVLVYTVFVKNITLSADEHLIERARQTAREQHKTLNTAFREWLETYVAESGNALQYDEVMRRLSHVRAGRKFSRDEMNERR